MTAEVASTSIDININHAFRTLGTVKSLKHELDKDYFDDIEQIFEKAMKDVSDRTSEFLCNLPEFKQPNAKVLKQIIHMVPSSLKVRDEYGSIPIHKIALGENTFQYVHLFAEAAIEHNVFEEYERGGLLVEEEDEHGPFGDPTNWNTLQILASEGRVDTMKELRARNLLMKEDIIADNLIVHAAHDYRENTLNYLLELEPDALNAHIGDRYFRGLPITHAIIEDSRCAIALSILAKIAMKYHQYDIGLIFQKDQHGTTAIGKAIDHYGEEETFKYMNKYLIPFIDPEVRILHHCAKDAPQLMNTFTKYYPSAIFLRDKYGRTLRQAELACGNKTFEKDAYFFANITDADLRVADPKDDLYPFMMAASRMDTTCTANQTENDDLNHDTNSDVLTPQVPRCDLSAVYYMIKRDPSLVYGGKQVLNNRKRKIAKV